MEYTAWVANVCFTILLYHIVLLLIFVARLHGCTPIIFDAWLDRTKMSDFFITVYKQSPIHHLSIQTILTVKSKTPGYAFSVIRHVSFRGYRNVHATALVLYIAWIQQRICRDGIVCVVS